MKWLPDDRFRCWACGVCNLPSALHNNHDAVHIGKQKIRMKNSTNLGCLKNHSLLAGILPRRLCGTVAPDQPNFSILARSLMIDYWQSKGAIRLRHWCYSRKIGVAGNKFWRGLIEVSITPETVTKSLLGNNTNSLKQSWSQAIMLCESV